MKKRMGKISLVALFVIVSILLTANLFMRPTQAIPRSDARDAYYRIPQYISSTATDVADDLFDVENGSILILDFVGVVTTAVSATETSLGITLDADTGGEDYGFSTYVAITSASAGNRIVFTSANPSVLTPLAGTATGATSFAKSWICEEGVIEQARLASESGTSTGAIKWYMVYIPVDDSVVVTAQ